MHTNTHARFFVGFGFRLTILAHITLINCCSPSWALLIHHSEFHLIEPSLSTSTENFEVSSFPSAANIIFGFWFFIRREFSSAMQVWFIHASAESRYYWLASTLTWRCHRHLHELLIFGEQANAKRHCSFKRFAFDGRMSEILYLFLVCRWRVLPLSATRATFSGDINFVCIHRYHCSTAHRIWDSLRWEILH